MLTASPEADISYQFATSEQLMFSEQLHSQSIGQSQGLLFKSFLMVVHGSQPVEPSGLFDRTHTLFNQGFKNLFYQIDDFFGNGQPASLQEFQSWARIRVGTIRSAGENPRFKAAMKLRVVLPKAEQRFRLLFSTEDEQLPSAAGTQRARSNEADRDGFSLALRFIRAARKNGSINYDLGTRYRDRKAQIFARINMLYAHDLKWGFRSSFSNSLYYYSASGYENKFRYVLSRPIMGSDSVQFRGSTELVWKEDRHGELIGETVGVYFDMDDYRSVAVEGLGYYTTALNDDQTDKLLGAEFRVRFRHNVWRRWFFYEAWPTISWEPVTDYSPSFGGVFRIEVVLGKH